MSKLFENFFTEKEVNYLNNLPEVLYTKKSIDKKNNGSVYFSIPTPSFVKEKLYNYFGLDFLNIQSIPMRWIKGDTAPHIDRGSNTFDNTYLVYLNDSPGEFILDKTSYPINQGSAYVFSEGLNHETKNTGSEPRLLLGPMSEQGFAVGGINIYANGATDTVYIADVAGTVSYKINNGSWTAVPFACYVGNSNGDPANNILKVLFSTNITLTNWNQNFWCATDGIQFGSKSINADGSIPQITISNAPTYRGLILNGTVSSNGYNHIYIYNLNIVATGTSTLDDGTNTGYAGWVGGPSYGRGASNNYIVNCSSDGPIGTNNGGIVGMGAAESGGSLTLRGCSSRGSISGTGSGGIAGSSAGGSAGSVTCEQCWSEADITAQDAGGIFGWYAGTNSGYALAIKCYSIGQIGSDGGGIFGGYAGESTGQAHAQKCYSRGDIGASAGGIFSRYAGYNDGTCTATNCYSSGSIGTGYGIYGVNQRTPGTSSLNCYAADANWSDVTASTSLTGVPSGTTPGSVWSSRISNQPYELVAIGYTPYTVDIIDGSSDLIQSYSQTVAKGQASSTSLAPDASGNAFSILQKSGGDSDSYSTITINAQTGAISTTSATTNGTYTITVRSVGSYNITTFSLTVTDAIVIASTNSTQGVSCCSLTLDLTGIDYTQRNQIITGNTLIGNTSSQKYPISYTDIYNMKMAYAAKR